MKTSSRTGQQLSGRPILNVGHALQMWVISGHLRHVSVMFCFTPESGHQTWRLECLLRAKSGHCTLPAPANRRGGDPYFKMRPSQSGCAYFKRVTPRESLCSDGWHRSLYSKSRFSCSVIRESGAWVHPCHRLSKLSRIIFCATTAGSPAGARPMTSWASADRGKTKSAIKQATHKPLRRIRISRLRSKIGTPR
jgi:hypothetical protein